MLNTSRFQRSAGHTGSGGFTLVELLVVIGIIAILAGVALGPITSGIKKAQQSGAVQSARSLALAEFQYQTDNNNIYPSGTDLVSFLTSMMPTTGGTIYISDTSMLVISGSKEKKFSGGTLSSANCSYDFTLQTTTVGGGLDANTPDALPVVYSSILTPAAVTAVGPKTVTPDATWPCGVSGIAMCLKSNRAVFVQPVAPAVTVNLTDSGFPAYTWTSVVGGG